MHLSADQSSTAAHPLRRRNPLRSAVALALALAAIVLPSAWAGTTHAQSTASDITNDKLQMSWSYPDPTTGSPTTVNTGGLLNADASKLTSAEQAVLDPIAALAIVPWGPALDQAWSQTPGPKGQTVLQQACTVGEQQLTQQATTGNYHAYGPSCAFTPTGGTVYGELETQWGVYNQRTLQYDTVNGQRLTLSYVIPHNQITFNVTTPYTTGSLDPQFTATFDLGVSLQFTVFDGMFDGPCDLTQAAYVSIQDLSVDANNTSAGIAMQIPEVQQYMNTVISVVNGEVINGSALLGQSGSSGSNLGPLSQIWSVACKLGFNKVAMSVDSAKGLSIQFQDTSPWFPPGPVGSLFAATIQPTSSQQVRAGGQIAISGTYFTYASGSQGSNTVQFSLDSDPGTTIGQATISQNGTFTTNVTIPKDTPAGQHTLTAQVAAPSTQQASTTITVLGARQAAQPELAIVDPNTGALTSSGRSLPGNSITLHGNSFPADQTVTVYLDSDGGQQVGTVQAGDDGSFQASFTTPQPQNGYGSHSLVAVAQTASGRTVHASASLYVDAPAQ